MKNSRIRTMNALIWLSTVGLLVGSLAWSATALIPRSLPDGDREAPPEPRGPSDVAAIGAVLDRQVRAWNRGDLEGFMQGYWNSRELSFYSGGNKLRGWQETLERYKQRYQSEGQEMGRLEFVDVDIQLLAPDAALIRGGWELQTSKGPQGGLFTLIFRKTSQGWKIVHDHTSSRQ